MPLACDDIIISFNSFVLFFLFNNITHITEIPGYGDKSAVTMCERLDIKSTKDKDKLKVNLYCLFGVIFLFKCTGSVAQLFHCVLSLTLTLISNY